MPRTVLVLVPHPDDAEFYAGGTIARLIEEGASAYIVVATDGQKGSYEYKSDDLVHLRAQEAARGAAALGAEPPILLNHPDLELDSLPPGFLRQQYIHLIRQYKPGVVIAEDPFSRDEVHPDHRAVAWAASDAIAYASLPLVHPEHLAEGLEPHFTPEKYFYSEDPSNSNKIVDITSTMEKKLAALGEHKTQVSFLVEDVKRQAHLAGLDLSAIMGTSLSEPMMALAWALKEQASRIGKKAGVEYAEAFRYVRFHPFIESLLESG